LEHRKRRISDNENRCVNLSDLELPGVSRLLNTGPGRLDQPRPLWGWKNLPFEATGFFAIRERDGIWWLATPQGHAFLSKGVNNVSFRADDAPTLGYSPYERAVQDKYDSQDAWAKAVVDRLGGWGFNTLGSWSSPSTFTQDMPYTVNLNLATRAGADWLKGAVGDFFSKDFEEQMEAACRQLCGPRAKDPWLLGYFTDNELRWGADWRAKRACWRSICDSGRCGREEGRVGLPGTEIW